MNSPLLDHCPPSLPREAYVDAGWFGREQAAIWAHDWVCIGHKTGFDEAVLHMVAIAGQSVILHRRGEAVTAFHNLCLHRGAQLCAHSGPLGRLITCPYHAWSYAADDGRLVSTAFATPTADFDQAAHGLMPVAARVWNGLVYLSLADVPPDFAPDLGTEALDHWPMDDLIVGHRHETRLACNWKVFWENYNECLHCPGIHPGLSALVPVYTRGIMSAAEAPDYNGKTGPVLRKGARSWTMTGAPCGPEFAGLTGAERAEGHRFVTVYPSMFVVAHVDYVRTVRLDPISAGETRLIAEWLFLPQTLAQPDFDLGHVTDFARTVLAEDGAACEMNQRGLNSPAWRQGTLMPQEFDIHRFHVWVLARLDACAGEGAGCGG